MARHKKECHDIYNLERIRERVYDIGCVDRGKPEVGHGAP